ncbi:LIM domain-containing protein [Sarotherodon galilaeus]
MDSADSFSSEYNAEMERMFLFPHPGGNGATATPLLHRLFCNLVPLEGPRGPSSLLFPLGVLENRTSLLPPLEGRRGPSSHSNLPPLEGPRGPSSLRRLQCHHLRLPRHRLQCHHLSPCRPVRPARPARPVGPLSRPMTGRHGRPPELRHHRCLPPGRPPELFSGLLGRRPLRGRPLRGRPLDLLRLPCRRCFSHGRPPELPRFGLWCRQPPGRSPELFFGTVVCLVLFGFLFLVSGLCLFLSSDQPGVFIFRFALSPA